MKYLAAYALCALNGAPTKDQVTKVLKAAGADVDAARITELFKQFEGKDFNAIANTGKGKIGAGGAGAGAGAAPAAKAAAPAAAAPKKEEKKDESDDEMGFGLFD
jgi:large subunit ribosomal protein LP2